MQPANQTQPSYVCMSIYVCVYVTFLVLFSMFCFSHFLLKTTDRPTSEIIQAKPKSTNPIYWISINVKFKQIKKGKSKISQRSQERQIWIKNALQSSWKLLWRVSIIVRTAKCVWWVSAKNGLQWKGRKRWRCRATWDHLWQEYKNYQIGIVCWL